MLQVLLIFSITYVPMIFHAKTQLKYPVVLEKKLIFYIFLLFLASWICHLTQFDDSETLESSHAPCARCVCVSVCLGGGGCFCTQPSSNFCLMYSPICLLYCVIQDFAQKVLFSEIKAIRSGKGNFVK